MTPNRPHRRRLHPARRARRITGAPSVAGMVVLTGGLAVIDRAATAARSVAATATASAASAATPAALVDMSTHAS